MSGPSNSPKICFARSCYSLFSQKLVLEWCEGVALKCGASTSCLSKVGPPRVASLQHKIQAFQLQKIRTAAFFGLRECAISPGRRQDQWPKVVCWISRCNVLPIGATPKMLLPGGLFFLPYEVLNPSPLKDTSSP